ncbi:unnamed protein product [Parnassius mnemosyne]|uniref:Uncharacterized protein n=1 Tax=Parnassius mnemosyne TaxID=213953 RepID=A0AAV1LB88_9NEOP
MEAGEEIVEIIFMPQCNEYDLLETERDQASPAPQISKFVIFITPTFIPLHDYISLIFFMYMIISVASGSRATAVASPPPTEEQVQEVTMESPAPQITVSGSRAATVVTSPPTLRQERRRRIRNLHPRKTVAERANITRRDILAVAKSNAESMRMLAAATQVQAEAAKMQAEAAKVQAEASLLLAQAANKIGDALILFVNKNNK